jgi:phage baseplate assembly protein W
MINLSYLGGAEKWPTELNSSGQVMLTSELDLIEQSIIRYLSCPYGTEFFNGETGSRIGQLQYELNDNVLQVLLDTVISETIDRYEGRVKYVTTEFEKEPDDDTKILCIISVMVLSKNKIHSFIWPYYNVEE